MSRDPSGARGLRAAVAVASLLAAGTARAASYMTPLFTAPESRPHRFLLLPLQAEFVKAKAVMTEKMIEEAAVLEKEGSLAIESALRKRGYVVYRISAEELRETPDLQALVTTINGHYNEVWGKILWRPGDVETGRYAIGEEVLRLAPRYEVDGVVISRLVAVGVTGGKTALSAITSLGMFIMYGQARLDVNIIDAKHGTVEGYFTHFRSCTLGTLTKKPAALMEKMTTRAMEDCPAAGEAVWIPHLGSWDPTAAATPTPTPPPPPPGAGDPVKEFESLDGDDAPSEP